MATVIAVALVAVEVQAAPKARAANPSQIHTYNISFQTSGQNMWGPSGQQPGSAPGITIVPSVSWNQSGTAGSESTLCTADLDSDCGSGDVDTPTADLDGDHTQYTDSDGDGPSHDCDPAPLIGTCTDKLEVVSDGHTGCPKDLDSDCGVGADNDVPGAEIDDDTSKGTFGGGVQSSTNGQVGLQLNFGDITGGSVSVSAPEEVQLTVEPPSGQQVTIQTSWSTPSAGSITSRAPVGGISLSGTVGVQGSSGGSACVVSCSTLTILPAHSGFAPQSLDTGAITDTSHIPILSVPFAQKLGAAGCTLKGWSGWLSSPDPTLGATIQGTGGQLSATGSDTFINAQLDMAQWASCLAGNPVPLSLTLPSSALPSNVSAGYNLLFAGANPQLSETQGFTFQPQPQVTLTFGAAMPYVVHTPGQAAVQGSGASVTMPAGSSVTVTAPWSGLSVTPSFSMSDTFTNKTSFTEDNSWNINALSTSGSFPGYSSPHACVTLLGKPYCMQGVTIFPGESWNEPPVYSQSYPGATSTQNAYGSGSPLGLSGPNHWDLGGFNTVTESPLSIQVGQAPAVTSASSAAFTIGQAGSFTVTTTGTPAASLIETGALSSGVTFTDNGDGTATLAGTPAAGTGGTTTTFTITASNGVSPDATQTFKLTIDQPPAITSTASTTFTTGQADSFTVTTTGPPAPGLTETGALPSGVTFKDNGDGTATLAGTPAAGTGGKYPFTVTASNGISPDATQSFTLTVDQPPAITSGDAAFFRSGVSVAAFLVTTTGFPTPKLSETGALPSGVTFTDNGNGTALLAGAPAAGTAGKYPFTVTASNGTSPDATQSFTLNIVQAPVITSAGSTILTAGRAGSFKVTTTGFPVPTLTETGTLPIGVTFKDNGNGTATLAGTPLLGTGGSYAITIKASNGVSPDATQSFTLKVDEPPAIALTDTGATFTTGQAGSFTVTTLGFPAPALTESGGLPGGVTFKDNGNGTATVAGTPAAGSGGTYPLTITASNGVGSNATQGFKLTVDQPPAITSTTTSATFTTGQAGSVTVTTTGFPTAALTESGALPGGVTFKDNGNGTATLAGTPAAGTGGSYALTITAANGVSPAATQSFTLKVHQPPAITSTTTSATFTTGQAGSVTVTTTGFPAPALTESGALPGGVTFKDSGDGTATLTGTPAAGSGGTYPLTITASNGVGSNATQGFKLTVDQPPAITSATTSATFTTGQAGSVTVTTTGFPTAALTETGALPAGVTFKDNGNGTATLAGTPAAGTGGRYALTITASNGVSPAATQSFTLTVDQPPAITSPASVTFTLGQAGSFTVGTTGFPTASLSDGGATLPGGVTFKDNGDGTATLAGTPAVGTVRVYPITLTATNGVAPDASQSFSFTVVRAPTATTITSTVQGPVVGQPVTYTATVSPAPDGGSLAFSDGGSPVAGCGQIALTAGRGTCDVTYTSPGSHSITAAYSGDPSYVGSTSDPLALAVAKAATRLTLTSRAVPLTICPPGDGHDPACSPDQGQPGPDGNGPGRAGRSPSGPPSRGDLRGNACSYVPVHDQGAGGLLATVSGSVYNAVHIPSGPDISVLCQSVTLTATVVVDAPGAGTPTGTVSFSDATTGQSLGTAALSTSGGVTTASLTLDSLPAGPQQIVASYVGDTDFLANSGSLTQRVEYIFAGLLPPLDPSRPLEAGATVPVTFTLLDAHGRVVRDASATLLVNGNPAVPRGRTDVRDRNGNQAVPGDAFRFQGEHYQYDLDLRTQGLTGGTATLTIGVGDGTTYSFTLTIRSRPVPLQQSPGRNQHSPNGDTTPRR